MNYIVYVITNTVGKLYIGQTANLFQRLDYHNEILKSKKSSYTYKQKQGTWEVVYTEKFTTRSDAMRREKQLKTAKGREFLKKIIQDISAHSSVGRAGAS
ncbi:MAG: GIY-YIG nuclease family protein [Candidatus Paceibacterota bacterium]|nr:GIY-YIG nuclease family protein [Candidatus Paceibacterota bacterium]